MTDEAFRGPPDEHVACVRVERSDGFLPAIAFDVVAYFPRGVRGVGPRKRWPIIGPIDHATAASVAQGLSDLLWHAREDGARAKLAEIRKTVGEIEVGCAERGMPTPEPPPRPPTPPTPPCDLGPDAGGGCCVLLFAIGAAAWGLLA